MGSALTNLFAEIPARLPEELISRLVDTPHVRIERIVSQGHQSPGGFWYDQDEDEWVILLRGSARLLFEDQEQPVDLTPGDWINIPAHRRHRVDSTAQDEQTVWLAVFSPAA